MSQAKPSGAPGSGYEPSDLSPHAIAIFGIALAATVIACLFLAGWIFNYLSAREARQDVPPSPLAKREAPSEPLLQVAAPKELEGMRAQEEKILHSYDWVSKQAGTVRIPIERAMQLLAERGQQGQPAKAKSK